MKTYNLCVVGAGCWGINHIKTLNQLGCLAGIVDSDIATLNKIKTQYPECLTFSNLEKTFKENFDAYIVATPPKTHFNIAMTILKNKKPLLVEKPLTLDLSESIKINEYAKKNKINLMVGHLLLFHPAFVKMKKIYDEGQLGKIQYIYSNRLNLGKFRNDENVLWSFAPHDISLFNYFFNSTPLSVVSNGVDILRNNIHDTTITSLKYNENRMGHIFVSWLHPFKEHRFVIVGSEGMIHFEDSGVSKPLIFYSKLKEFKESLNKSNLEQHEIFYGSELPLTAQLKYFISKLESGKLEKANGDSAVDVMRVLDAATQNLNVN